ncbi:hypothetical protein CK203_077276 [Vitis vinifera]|uniref:Structural maintenance of chromosomes flexible hinge domain-containing protein GMI1 n=1 Tax=Vitis vinifera TaxID=29760 RepID=A0A438BU87_VITVI|nr:hypothetical protein CK203_077276 [Vitis vinifera]
MARLHTVGCGRGLYPMQGASRQSYVSELLGPINYRLQTWHETSTLCELSVSRTLASLSQLAHLEPWLCTWSKMNRVRIEHARPTAPSPGAYSFDLPYMEEEVPPQRGKKRSIVEISGHNDLGAIYKFKILLPNAQAWDGSGQSADTFKNMWDLTPDTDLLAELPEEYAFETALADLIVSCHFNIAKIWFPLLILFLYSVDIVEDRISIFDSGPGMDGSDENSIVKWGKMGASLHRSSKAQAIGGKPPYLKPFFGMFGYGGPIASMHLGRCALVSSKTKESKKVYTLHLEREALLSSSGSDLTWRTSGGIRYPSEEETEKSPHGSFTKVEIFKPKIEGLNVFQLQRKLKDIYFPYIQCDEVCDTGKTNTPVEFQVNGLDLAEIDGGEVGTTNLHSSNGPEFVLQLRFYGNQDNVATKSPGLRSSQEANARLKCVYFPIVEGKENLETILEKLEAEGCGTNENYDTFSRVSIRRLGRLLPDARWVS